MKKSNSAKSEKVEPKTKGTSVEKTVEAKKTGTQNERKPKRKEGIISKSINRILLKVLLILLCLCALCAGGYFGFNKLMKIQVEKKSMLAVSQLEKCAELVTMKNNYSDVVTIKKTRIAGLAKSFSIVRFNGTLRVGIKDISKTKLEVSNNGKRVNVKLPDCEILGNDIAEIDVFDETRSIFVAVTLKEIVDEINSTRSATESKLIDEGILEEARRQSVQIVKNILQASGFAEVHVE